MTGIKYYYGQAISTVRGAALQLDRRTAGFAGLVYRANMNFLHQGFREAAALAYYALFSLFPLMLLVILFIGYIIGPTVTQNQLGDFLSFFLPGATATELNHAIAHFVEQGSSASIVAILTLFWSALGLFSNLEAAMSRVFRDTQPRPFLRRRAMGFVMILTMGVLLSANIVTSLLFSLLNLLFLDQRSVWLSVAGTFIPFGFSVGIFAMIYRWLPRSRVGWDAIWPAALLGAMAWELAKQVFVWYLDKLGNLSLVYGSITTVIIFMLWAFYTACIILIFAEFCVALAAWLEERNQHNPLEYQHGLAQEYYENMLNGAQDKR